MFAEKTITITIDKIDRKIIILDAESEDLFMWVNMKVKDMLYLCPQFTTVKAARGSLDFLREHNHYLLITEDRIESNYCMTPDVALAAGLIGKKMSRFTSEEVK